MTVDLDQARAEYRSALDGEIGRLEDRVAALIAERDLLAPPSERRVEVPVAAVSKPPPSPKKGRPRRDEPQECPECGKSCASPQGLAAHRRSTHGVKGRDPHVTKPAPLKVVEPTVDRCPQLSGSLRLRCATCDESFVSVKYLARHTLGTHGREPLTSERQPSSGDVA